MRQLVNNESLIGGFISQGLTKMLWRDELKCLFKCSKLFTNIFIKLMIQNLCIYHKSACMWTQENRNLIKKIYLTDMNNITMYPNIKTIYFNGDDIIIDSFIIFPPNIKLLLVRDFNQMIHPGVLPNSLTKLSFSNHFNKPLSKGVFPDSLTKL